MSGRILENDRYRLRPVEPDDALFMWEVESDSLQWVQNRFVAPFSRENLREYALNYDADPYSAGQLRLIFEGISDGERLGIADLYDLLPQQRTAWVGIYILPGHRGNGTGREALALLEQYSRRILNLRRLGAKIVGGNEASRRLFCDSGYEWAGTLADWIQSGSDFYSLEIFQKPL